jgi:hypothetical protein
LTIHDQARHKEQQRNEGYSDHVDYRAGERLPRQGVEKSQKECPHQDEGDDKQVNQHAGDVKGYLVGTS